MKMTSLSEQRRARTRSLIQLGGLMERAGTLDVFKIPLGVDLQKDVSLKNNIAALFKAKGLSETRPLDKKEEVELSQNSENSNEQKSFHNSDKNKRG